MSEERTVETKKETKLAPAVKFPVKRHPLKMTAKSATKTIEGAPTKAEPAFVEAGAEVAPASTIRDLDLAERLGFAQPRMVRKLIKRLIEEGELTGVYMRTSRQRISKPNGGEELREVSEYWLTEEQALLIASHSKAPNARVVTNEMIAGVEEKDTIDRKESDEETQSLAEMIENETPGFVHTKIQLEGWSLLRAGTEDDPMVMDLEVARKLGYTRPREIRRLIARMDAAGELGVVCFTNEHMRATVVKGRGTVPRPPSPKNAYPSITYYLTEAQCLKVIARSETPMASKILDEVIGVYMAWRRGVLLTTVGIDRDARAVMEALRSDITSIRASVDVLFHAVLSQEEYAVFLHHSTQRAIGAVRSDVLSLRSSVEQIPLVGTTPAPAPIPAPVPQPKPVSEPAPLTLTAPTPPLPRQGKGVRWVEDLASELGCRVDQAWMMAKAVGRKFHESYRAHRPGVGLRWRFCSELVERIRDYHARYGIPTEAKN